MVTTLQPKTPHTIKLEFADEPVTSFAGLALAERAAARLGPVVHPGGPAACPAAATLLGPPPSRP